MTWPLDKRMLVVRTMLGSKHSFTQEMPSSLSCLLYWTRKEVGEGRRRALLRRRASSPLDGDFGDGEVQGEKWWLDPCSEAPSAKEQKESWLRTWAWKDEWRGNRLLHIPGLLGLRFGSEAISAVTKRLSKTHLFWPQSGRSPAQPKPMIEFAQWPS